MKNAPSFKISEADIETLENAIFYLKVDELKRICIKLSIHPSGVKQDLIDSIFAAVKGETPLTEKEPAQVLNQLLNNNAQDDPEIYIVPGKYSNNRVHREKFKTLIGEHFSFTTYGMDWIKEKWAKGLNPSFTEFAVYWEAEFQRRKSGGSFSSKKTLQRVNFFRQMKDKKMSKTELEKAWQQKRREQANIALELISKITDKQ